MIPDMDVTFDPESLAGPRGRFAALVAVEKEVQLFCVNKNLLKFLL
jgi:hypothetical protein